MKLYAINWGQNLEEYMLKVTKPCRITGTGMHVPSEVPSEKIETELSYVPNAHVQFLEQSGVQVVPIDFRLSKDELFKAFDKVNGLYMPGDSHLAVLDEKYRFAF